MLLSNTPLEELFSNLQFCTCLNETAFCKTTFSGLAGDLLLLFLEFDLITPDPGILKGILNCQGISTSFNIPLKILCRRTAALHCCFELPPAGLFVHQTQPMAALFCNEVFPAPRIIFRHLKLKTPLIASSKPRKNFWCSTYCSFSLCWTSWNMHVAVGPSAALLQSSWM